MKADTERGTDMNTTTLKLAFSDPEQQRMLFRALMSYIEDRPVMVFGSNAKLLHGHETAKMIAGMSRDFSMNCCCFYGINPQEFDSSDWSELLEAARVNWINGATPSESYIEFVRAGADI
jgi:hypothetical protein